MKKVEFHEMFRPPKIWMKFCQVLPNKTRKFLGFGANKFSREIFLGICRVTLPSADWRQSTLCCSSNFLRNVKFGPNFDAIFRLQIGHPRPPTPPWGSCAKLGLLGIEIVEEKSKKLFKNFIFKFSIFNSFQNYLFLP